MCGFFSEVMLELFHCVGIKANKVGGSHSIQYNDFKEVMSGLRDMGYNVRMRESSTVAGGYQVMMQDPKTGAVVAGDIKNVITAYRQTADGATQQVLSTAGGDPIVSKSEVGASRTQFQNRLNVLMGVQVEGTATEGVRKAGSAIFGKDTGEAIAVGAGGAVDGIGTIGQTIGGLRNIGQLGESTFKQGPPSIPEAQGPWHPTVKPDFSKPVPHDYYREMK
jgi:hypothetical protein